MNRALGPGAAVLLLSIVFVAYLPALGAGFIWDDSEHVTDNATLRSLDGLRRIWLEIGAVPQYYPMVHTTFWLEYRLWGLRPTGYHVTNVLLHGLNAVLLWRLLRRLGVPGAWFAAAVFGLHPVHVESVAWVTERKNVLSAAFYLGAAHAWLRFLSGRDSGDRGSWRGYAAVASLYLGALLSKTVTATFPAAMLLLVWWKKGRITRREVVPTLPLFAVGIAAGLFTAWMERHHVGAVGKEWDLSLVDRVLVAGRALWFYAGKLLWPHPLVFVYPRWRVDPTAAWQYAFPACAIAVPCLLWALRDRLGRAPVVGALFFAGTLFPALGFLDVYPMRYSFTADHFQYLASLGLIVPVVGWAAGRLGRPAGSLIGVLVLVTLGAGTARQAAVYADAETLWRDTLAKNPRAWVAHNNLGALLVARGEGAEAREHFEAAVRIAPEAPEGLVNLGIILHGEARYDEAIASYLAALESDPNSGYAHYNLAITLGAVGRTEDAIVHFREAIRCDPLFARARSSLGRLLLSLGRTDEARAQLTEAALIDPTDPDTRRALAEAGAPRRSP